jgi:hypothetical protein
LKGYLGPGEGVTGGPPGAAGFGNTSGVELFGVLAVMIGGVGGVLATTGAFGVARFVMLRYPPLLVPSDAKLGVAASVVSALLIVDCNAPLACASCWTALAKPVVSVLFSRAALKAAEEPGWTASIFANAVAKAVDGLSTADLIAEIASAVNGSAKLVRLAPDRKIPDVAVNRTAVAAAAVTIWPRIFMTLAPRTRYLQCWVYNTKRQTRVKDFGPRVSSQVITRWRLGHD